MDINKTLEELRQERECLEEAILCFERLARGSGRRRGRPPKWMLESRTSADTNPTRKPRKSRDNAGSKNL